MKRRGSANRPPRAPTLHGRTPEDLSKCVVLLERQFIETVKIDGQDVEVWLRFPDAKRATPKRVKHVGTGFFVATETAAFLVTAAHVAEKMDGEARLSIRNRRGRRSSIQLSQLVSPVARKVGWIVPRNTDVAVVRIPKPPAALRGRCLAASGLALGRTAPSGTVELTMIGFPLGLTSEKHFAPMAKRVHAASGILPFSGEEMGDPADFFLLDQPSMGGYSGAPVFVIAGQHPETGDVSLARPRCVGLISRTISDESGGQFAAVVPSAAIRKALARAHV
jgi:hypothetical protein